MNTQMPHISVAPMMDWTDRHCRYFHRLLSPNVRLYTEMVTTGAIIHGDKNRYLKFNPEEHYVALQLGGSDAADMAECAKIGEQYGYDEININCGCPSERVQKGAFGACLMAEPDTVARSVEAMVKAVKIPVTVKCRIGIDDVEEGPFLRRFVKTVSEAGCTMFVIHARKAWLKGLSPKENREIPPIDYALPAAIKAENPHLEIIVNGQVKTVKQARAFLNLPLPSGERVGVRGKPHTQTYPAPSPKSSPPWGEDFNGVMIGREAYQNPGLLLDLERDIYGTAPMSAEDAVLAMIPYIEKQARDHGTPMKSITRHMLGLFQGMRGSRTWRRTLSVDTHAQDATPDLLAEALKAVA